MPPEKTPAWGSRDISYLLRKSYRQGERVLHRTLANVSYLPEDTIELVRRGLRGEQVSLGAEAPVRSASGFSPSRSRCGALRQGSS